MSVDWIETPDHPSLAASERAVHAALAHAVENSFAVAVVVVDAQGQLICGKRMDAARPVTSDLALAKARLAATHQRATDQFQELVVPGGPAYGLQHHPQGGAGILPGGLPLQFNTQTHGAVAASGADKTGDIACAQAARAVLLGPEEN